MYFFKYNTITPVVDILSMYTLSTRAYSYNVCLIILLLRATYSDHDYDLPY